jgi:release factor glutamine methyltransferase
MKTSQEWINWSVRKFLAAGIEAPSQTALELLAHACHRPKAKVLAGLSEPLRLAVRKAFQALVLARCRRVPLQYLLGTEHFGGLIFKVGVGVLIPRPETELVLEEVQHRAKDELRLIADLGTGSGNLALALAARYPRARLWGIDRSSRALAWARKNLRDQRPGRRVRFVQGTGPSALPRSGHGHFDLVVSNPPYIPSATLGSLQPEVRREPKAALDGGPDGLREIRRMLATAHQLLRVRGLFVCEIGISQKPAVWKLFASVGFSGLNCRLDWQGIPRVISGEKRP